MAERVKILLVEDSRMFAQLTKSWLQTAPGADFEIEHAMDLESGISRLAEGDIDLVLLDLWLPDSSGMDTFVTLQAQSPQTPVVVLTGADDETMGMNAVGLGAQDYVVKGSADRAVLARSVLYAIERARTVRARSEFFAAISHEFRTPLFAIMANAELLLDPDFPMDETEEVRKIAETVKESGKSLLGQVDQILDLSKLASGSFELTLGEVRICDVAGELARELGPLAHRSRLELEWQVPADLPQVHADRVRTRQVLLNLVSNAIKYTPPGGRVVVSARSAEGGVQVAVADTGPGVPPDAAPHVFEPYYQVQGTVARHGQTSTGLGLALTRGLVEAQGGRIWLESEPGKGATFSFTLNELPPPEA